MVLLGMCWVACPQSVSNGGRSAAYVPLITHDGCAKMTRVVSNKKAKKETNSSAIFLDFFFRRARTIALPTRRFRHTKLYHKYATCCGTAVPRENARSDGAAAAGKR